MSGRVFFVVLGVGALFFLASVGSSFFCRLATEPSDVGVAVAAMALIVVAAIGALAVERLRKSKKPTPDKE